MLITDGAESVLRGVRGSDVPSMVEERRGVTPVSPTFLGTNVKFLPSCFFGRAAPLEPGLNQSAAPGQVNSTISRSGNDNCTTILMTIVAIIPRLSSTDC